MFLLLVGFLGCGTAAADPIPSGADVRPIPADVPPGPPTERLRAAAAQPSVAPVTVFVNPHDGEKSAEDKSFYHGDNRVQFFEIARPQAKENARGVASISKLSKRTIPGQNFCTAFLIARDKVLTASHCLSVDTAGGSAIRFNDYFLSPTTVGTLDSFKARDVLTWDPPYDLAIVTVEPNGSGALPGDSYPVLTLSKVPTKVKDQIYMIGNPGNDFQYSGDCEVITEPYVSKTKKHTFGVDCNGFYGNSGSPVFAAGTDKVVGIFWGGQSGNQRFPIADAIHHEYVVPMWEIAIAASIAPPCFLEGRWPADVTFVAGLLPGMRMQRALEEEVWRSFPALAAMRSLGNS